MSFTFHWKKIGLGWVFCAGLLASPSWGLSPVLRWRTIRTSRFAIHYHQQEQDEARRSAAIAESVLPKLESKIGARVSGRIELVLLDDADIANGSATPFPYNAVLIYLPSPEADSSIADFDDWLRLVITHELTHIVHLDMAKGLPRAYRTLFGRTPAGFLPFLPTAFPNISQPVWLIEGYAAHEETALTSAGRGRSAIFDMMLRCAALEGHLSTLGELTDWQTSWPGGTIRYLYGESLYQYMEDHTRPDAPGRIAQSNSENLYPQFHINSAPESMGFNYRSLYDRWKRDTLSHYQTQADAIEKRPLTKSTPLTHRGYSITSPSYSPDGTRIAYAEANADELPSIRLMNRDGSHDIRLARGWVRSGPRWSPDGNKIAFSMLDFNATYSLKADLYLYDVKRRRLSRLTRAHRAVDPSWAPDGTHLIYSRLEPGHQDLMVFDLATRTETRLLQGKAGEQFAGPTWAPDGKRVAYSHWDESRWDIELLDIDSGARAELTKDRALDFSPTWSPDGQTLYFSSDRTGVFNIFSVSLTSSTVEQVTNVIGGAFDPTLSPSTPELTFSNYSSRGFDLHQAVLTSYGPALPYKDIRPPLPSPEPAAEIRSDKPYNATYTLLPRFWFPNFNGGAFTAGQDVLAKHFLFLNVNINGDHEITYANQQLFPVIEVNRWKLDDSQSHVGSGVGMGTGTRGESLFLRFPLIRVLHAQEFSVGILKSDVNLDRAHENGIRVGDQTLTSLQGYETGWTFANAKIYGFSVAPEDGRRLFVDYFRQGPETGKEDGVNVVQGGWDEFLPGFGRHHVLDLGVGGGRSNLLAFDSLSDARLALSQLKARLRSAFVQKIAPGQRADIPHYPLSGFSQLPPIHRPDDGFFSRTTYAQASYAFPIAYIEKAPGTGFFFLDRIRGQVFGYGDRYWNEGQTAPLQRWFTGAELATDWGLSYFFPLSISVDVEKQMDEGGPWHVNARAEIGVLF